jgi:hypothetical protein
MSSTACGNGEIVRVRFHYRPDPEQINAGLTAKKICTPKSPPNGPLNSILPLRLRSCKALSCRAGKNFLNISRGLSSRVGQEKSFPKILSPGPVQTAKACDP